MKKKELKEMSKESLASKLKELEKELSLELGIARASGGKARSPGKIKSLKKTIARIKTYLGGEKN